MSTPTTQSPAVTPPGSIGRERRGEGRRAGRRCGQAFRGVTTRRPQRTRVSMHAARQPAIFVPHGGGPCFWIEFPPPFGPHAWDGFAITSRVSSLAAGAAEGVPGGHRPLGGGASRRSASTPSPACCTMTTAPRHALADYPAPGDPELAAGVKRLIAAGRPARRDRRKPRLRPRRVRALPHRRPEGRNPGRHAVAAPRSRSGLPHQARQGAQAAARPGVTMVGSGMSFTTSGISATATPAASATFDAWLDETAKRRGRSATPGSTARDKALSARRCPSARGASPAAHGGRRRRGRQRRPA